MYAAVAHNALPLKGHRMFLLVEGTCEGLLDYQPVRTSPAETNPHMGLYCCIAAGRNGLICLGRAFVYSLESKIVSDSNTIGY